MRSYNTINERCHDEHLHVPITSILYFNVFNVYTACVRLCSDEHLTIM